MDGGGDRLHLFLARRVQGRLSTGLVLARAAERDDRRSVFSPPSAQRAVTFEHRARGLFERDRAEAHRSACRWARVTGSF